MSDESPIGASGGIDLRRRGGAAADDEMPAAASGGIDLRRQGAAAADDEMPVAPAPDGASDRTKRRRVVLVVVLVALVLVGYYAVSLLQVWSTGRAEQARPVDAIVVLGAAQYDGRPSPQLAARLDHVLDIWPDGFAPVVVVTGGKQAGDRFTEAEASADYLIDRGLPSDAIILEDTGSTTYESMQTVARLLDPTEVIEAGGTVPTARVVIVTDPYHALRSELIAEELGLIAYVSPTDTSVVTGPESVRRHLQEAAGVSVGRLIGFGRLSRLTD